MPPRAKQFEIGELMAMPWISAISRTGRPDVTAIGPVSANEACSIREIEDRAPSLINSNPRRQDHAVSEIAHPCRRKTQLTGSCWRLRTPALWISYRTRRAYRRYCARKVCGRQCRQRRGKEPVHQGPSAHQNPVRQDSEPRVADSAALVEARVLRVHAPPGC
jgi:hypothetical protein